MKILFLFCLFFFPFTVIGDDIEALVNWRAENPRLTQSGVPGWSLVGSGTTNACNWQNVILLFILKKSFFFNQSKKNKRRLLVMELMKSLFYD